MNQEFSKIKSFTDLNVWKEAHGLVLSIYKAAIDFPKEELFGLTNQMRRAAVSITSNIAEGFSRSSYRDKSHFYTVALGSLSEIQSQLLVARDLKYIKKEKFTSLASTTITVSKLLNGLIKKSKTMIHDSRI